MNQVHRVGSWAWLWRELTRPRGISRKATRAGRSSRAGVALLMAMTTIFLMTVLITEIAEAAAVRVRMSAHLRDEAKAESLALTGLQIHRIVLILSRQMGNNPMIMQFSQMMGLNADTLWQMMPTVSSSMMRLIFVSGGDADEAQDIAAEGMTEEMMAETRKSESSLKKAFLDFDGDFSSTVTDENRKIYVGRLNAQTLADLQANGYAQQLYGLMSGQRQDEFLNRNNFDKWELISNLVDWTDIDDRRLYEGGSENMFYERLENPYKAKNTAFDTQEEIRLVDGWQFDQVWYRYGQHLTIYGDGQINVNTAEDRVLEGLMMAYITPRPYDVQPLIGVIKTFRNTPPEYGGGIFRDPSQFVSLVQSVAPGIVSDQLRSVISTQSNVFRVVSEGLVGDSSVKLEVVLDFRQNPVGEVLYWRVD
jgi:type II secretory pathway component PulK